MYIKKFIFLLLFLEIILPFFAIEEFVDLDLIKNETSPRFLKEGFLFTLAPDIGRVIFLKTNIDNWEKSYYFKKSLYGVYYLFLPYDYKTKTVYYKINIDGFWDRDPNNDNYIEDKYGVKISVIQIPDDVLYFQKMPVIEDINNRIKKVKFKYYNPEANEVNLICSLDNWSPFTNSMTKNEEGFWEIELNFSKGKYFYYFLVDWRKVVDMKNPYKVYDPEKGEVSMFIIE
ncbi:MAG TPA: hypothetical protein PLE45_06415 [Spirochaetota bacterium]|nr:hypothetical protein [Spirochaetota bacterium]HOL56892.1 hypothetical protein [Spirochaetota bacterium]HPP04474.1 hypothetical protein [Spirochaetota bacterium]